MIVVWSLGGKLPGGLNVYGWTTAKLSRPSPQCKVVQTQPKEPSLAGLGPVTRTKDGWAFGRKFGCLETGRVLITLTEGAGKARMVVRLQKSGRVMAVGSRRRGRASLPGERPRRRLAESSAASWGCAGAEAELPAANRVAAAWYLLRTSVLPASLLQGSGAGAVRRLERALPPRLGEDRHHVGVELRARAPLELGNRATLRERASVGPVGGHRVERVGHGKHASFYRYLGARTPARVSVAIPALVVMEDTRHGRTVLPYEADHVRPSCG